MVKNPPANAGDSGLIPGSGDPPEKEMQPSLVFLPKDFLGQRSLTSHSP